ncbi:MAG: PaaI family thioesterase [Alphaproteobacteria bacterium]
MSEREGRAADGPKRKAFTGPIPHIQDLGIEMIEGEGGAALGRLPYDERLVGDPETGVLHGGVVTTLIDTVCGLAVVSSLDQPQPIATLDLRIDYLKPATPHEDLLARAQVYKITRQVVFVRAGAFQSDEEQPIATAVGTFMLIGRPASEKAGGAS